MTTIDGPILHAYMTVRELAAELRVHPRSIYRWASERTGPPRVQVGGRTLYRRAAVIEWLRAREVVQPRAPLCDPRAAASS